MPQRPDVAIIEIGGTVGDIESLPFLEAIRQLKIEAGTEQRAQHARHARPLHRDGRRAEDEADAALGEGDARASASSRTSSSAARRRRSTTRTKEKISLFSNVAVEAVIRAIDVLLHLRGAAPLPRRRGSTTSSAERLNIWSRQPDLSAWQRVCDRFKKPGKGAVKIGVVGKYVHLRDAYKSLHEALVHAGLSNDCKVDLEYIDSEADREGGAREAPRPPRRRARPGRVRRSRDRGEDRGDRLRAPEHDPLLRDLPRHAAGGRRVRAQRRRARGRQLHRVRPRHGPIRSST